MVKDGGGAITGLGLRLIGGFAAALDGRPVDLRNRKAQAALAVLALSGNGQPRERIAALLWSERDGEQARQSLRQTLHDLRRALGPGAERVLEIGRRDVGLRAPAPAVDILALIAAVEADGAEPPAADWAALADGVLAGFDDLDPAFAEWLTARRRALLDRLTAALEARMAAADDEPARRWAGALLALDPAHEPACRRLMESDAARGDVRAALRRYADLWDLLDDEYAAEPSPETQALAVALKSLEAAPEAQPRSPVAERPALTLCVDAFRLDGVPPEHGYLVRGFRQDLIACLTPWREWVVIEPGDGPPPRQDGVYALAAVAFPGRDGVRINLTLQETAARRFVWGQQDIELRLDTWFEACRLTTRRIAAALDVRVVNDRLARIAQAPDVAAPLYDRLLRARDLLSRWTKEDDARAEAIFRAILAADAGFARARIGVAQLLNTRHIVHPGAPRDPATACEALALARGAVEADPLDADAQLCLGWSSAMAARAGEAIEAFAAAADLNPTHPRTLASAAAGLAFSGDQPAAERLAETSLMLDGGAPRLHWAYRASVFMMGGRWKDALDAVGRGQSTTRVICGYAPIALAMLGRHDEARAAWRACVAEIADAWSGDATPTERDVAAWFLAAPPICDAAVHARFRAALAEAGADLP
ncbi:MAG: hypothetical protein EA355_02955 [Rhodobacteraceae bacterium]|nr:MAG: hypothetical protein EA355_02955 [Paracoccaceae bacterium]